MKVTPKVSGKEVLKILQQSKPKKIQIYSNDAGLKAWEEDFIKSKVK